MFIENVRVDLQAESIYISRWTGSLTFLEICVMTLSILCTCSPIIILCNSL